MKKIIYVTGNKTKFDFVSNKLKKYKIKTIQKKLDIKEIQGGEKFEIAIDKAKKAYELLKQPLFVTDTFWEIEAINGFPGAYMKYVNEWFSADHFINIMKGEKNRKAKATDSVVYIDANGIKTYTEEFLGEIATQKYQGKKKLKDSTGWDHVFMKDDRYLGEYHGDDENLVSKQNIWEEFSEFIKSN